MNFADLVTQQFINLGGKGLRDSDLDVLIKVLQKSTVHEELWLDDNQITLADNKFTNALARNRTLRVLYLDVRRARIGGLRHGRARLVQGNTPSPDAAWGSDEGLWVRETTPALRG